MIAETIRQLRTAVRQARPLIHCITNPISIYPCANAVLAVGARPIMAEHPEEVADITASAGALMLNLGNITDIRMASMQISARKAKKKGIPVVLDLVGISCSGLRKNFAAKLIAEACPTVLKGNYSEIKALYHAAYRCDGVDAEQGLTTEEICEIAEKLANTYGVTVLASGKTDIVTDGCQTVFIQNGSPQLAQITGTGCMLAALCACYLAVGSGIAPVVTACTVLGICGERAETDRGNGSFGIRLMDELSVLSEEALQIACKIEERKIQK